MEHRVTERRPLVFEVLDNVKRELSCVDVRVDSIETRLEKAIDKVNELINVLNAEPSAGFKFTTSSKDLVSLPEIAADMGRGNPFAEVVIEGADYSQLHYILLHTSVYTKMVLLSKVSGDSPIIESPKYDGAFAHLNSKLVKKLRVVTPTVCAIDVTDSGMTFRDMLAAIGWVRSMPLSHDGHRPVRVAVRYF